MRGAILLSVLAALLVAACAATAAPPRPQVLDRSPDVGAYSLAGNGAGDRLVVLPRDLAPDPAGFDVFSAPPAAPFGPPSQVRGPGVPDAPASVAVGPDGSGAVVGVPHRLRPADPDRVMALLRSPGGAFTAPVAISGAQSNDPDVAFDRAGNAMAIWARDVKNGSYVEESTHPVGGEWSTPTVIAHERRGASDAHVAFDASGAAVAVWTRDGISYVVLVAARRRDVPNQVVAALRPAGGDFGRPRVVSQPRLDSSEASLSVDPEGRAALVWVTNTPGDKHFRVGAAFRSPSRNRFGKPHFLTRPRDDGVGPAVALDSRGRGVITWIVNGEKHTMINAFRVRVAFTSRSGRVSRPHTISGPRADFPELAMNSGGGAVATWVYHGRHRDVVQARRISTRGRIGRLTPLSSRGGFDYPQAVIDDSGVATFGWTRYMNQADRLETITLRGSGSGPSSPGRTSRTRPGGR